MLFISRACFSLFLFSFFFLHSANYKGFTLAFLPWPLSKMFAEEGNADSIKEQSNHLLSEFTALFQHLQAGWGRGGESTQKKKKKQCQYDSRQCRLTTLLPYARGHGCSHITERGRLGDIRLSRLMGAGTNKTF